MIAFLAFAVPLTLYLSVPSCFWNFDGVACAAALELGQPAYLFHSNHLLYGALGFLFWRGIGLPLGLTRALPALQLFTSLLASWGLVGLYRILLPLLNNRWVALLLSSSLALTASFWVWSVEAQVYALGFLALAWATVALVQDPSPKKYIWVGLLHGGAVLGHIMHVLWMIPVLYWMYEECRRLHRPAQTIHSAILFFLRSSCRYSLLSSHFLRHRAWTRHRGRMWIWLKGSAGLTPDRSWAWHCGGLERSLDLAEIHPALSLGKFCALRKNAHVSRGCGHSNGLIHRHLCRTC